MTSPLITKHSNYKTDLNDDPYSTLYVENLLGGLNEWRNIQDIVRSTFKALCEVVRSQGIAIRELEKQITTKASKSELNSGLSLKANVADVMRTFSEVASSIENRPTVDEVHHFMEDKVNRSDMQYQLNSKPSLEEVRHLVETRVSHSELQNEILNLSNKFDDIYKDYSKKSQNYASIKEISQIYQELEQKANFKDVSEALALKASKDSVINALHRKANKNEIDSVLNSKVDLNDFQEIIKIISTKADVVEVDKIYKISDNKIDRNELINMINGKADLKDFELLDKSIQELKKDSQKRIDDIDQDLDRLIENIKKEFQSINSLITSIDLKKAEFKDFEKLNNQISKKLDSEVLSNTLKDFKNDFYENFSHYKNDFHQTRKAFEEHINEKLLTLDRSIEKVSDDLNRHKDKVNEMNERRKIEQDDIVKQTKILFSNYGKDSINDGNLIKSEIQKIKCDLEELFEIKIDKKEFDLITSKMFTDLDNKADLNDLESLFKNIQKDTFDKTEENKHFLNQSLRNFENDIDRALEKKVNSTDLNQMLSNKADAIAFNIAIQNKANISDIENLKLTIDKISKENLNKLDFNKFEAYINDTRQAVDELQKDLMMKSNLKEMLHLLKNKSDIDDVNKALTQIHEELDLKCNVEQFNSAMDNQAIINDALCAENCVARWTWKSGKVKNGYAVPWEIQTVNTAPDNFLWEKEKTSIMVVSAGLYELTMGFYADKKPTIQILVNGEPIMSAVNSASYVIHHSSGKLKNVGKHSSGNITGLTMIDYVCLPERARISISYSGEDGSEGFMGIRKI